MSKYPAFDAPAPAAPLSIPKPIGYHVIVEPREPPAKSQGGILLAEKTKRANRATDYIGKLLAVGEFAWKAKTAEIDWGTLQDVPQVGDLVIIKSHAGQKLRIRKDTATLLDGDKEGESYLLIMFDTDIIGKVTPEQADQFYAWV